MSLGNKYCIKLTSSYDIIWHKYILPVISITLIGWIILPVVIASIQSLDALNAISFIRVFISIILTGYVYYLTKPIVACEICKGYLLLKGYGKPVKVDFDNICSIDNADLIKEPGKNKCLVSIRFWKKTPLGQKVNIYIKKEYVYEGERINGETYLVKLITQNKK